MNIYEMSTINCQLSTMKKLFFFISLSLPLFAQAQVFTLSQCIDTAYANSIKLRQQEIDYNRKQILYRQAWHNLSPSLSAGIGESLSFGRSTSADNINRSQNISNTSLGVNASWVLFDGLAMKFNIDQAMAQVQAGDAGLEAEKRRLALNITSMYLTVLLKKELAAVAEAQLNNTNLQLERVRALVQAQRLPEGEFFTLDAQAGQEEYRLLQARNEVQLSLLNLAQAIDVPYDESFDIATPTDEELDGILLPDRDQVWQTALQNRPEIRRANYNLEAEQITLKSTKSAYSPTLSASAGVSTGYYHRMGAENTAFGRQLSDNLSTNVSFNLSIPIYDRMRTPNQVKTQQLAVENAELQVLTVKKEMRVEIDQAYYNALAARSEQLSAARAEHSAAEAERYAEEKFTAGRGTAYEYNEAKRALLQAQSELLQAKYNYLFKIRILEYYMGL